MYIPRPRDTKPSIAPTSFIPERPKPSEQTVGVWDLEVPIIVLGLDGVGSLVYAYFLSKVSVQFLPWHMANSVLIQDNSICTKKILDLSFIDICFLKNGIG